MTLLFTDIDYTTHTFPALEAYGSVAYVLQKNLLKFNKKEAIADNLFMGFCTLCGGMGEHLRDLFVRDVSSTFLSSVVCQDGVPEEAHWSRYAHFKLFLARWNFEWNDEFITFVAGLEKVFWRAITSKAHIYVDAMSALQHLKAHNTSIVGVTSSDVRIEAHKDALLPMYTPENSKALKRRRLVAEKVFEVIDEIFITDPEAKTNEDFWRWEIFPKYNGDLARATFVSDIASDMRAAKIAGIPKRVFLRRNNANDRSSPREATHVINDYRQVVPIVLY